MTGGLFSTQVTVQDTNPFGFAAIAGLVGMFSNQAALKLKEVAGSLFSSKESTKGKDHIEGSETTAKAEGETPTGETGQEASKAESGPDEGDGSGD